MRKRFNLNTKKIFGACCQNDIIDNLYLPSRVKQAAQELDGKTISLREAVQIIKKATTRERVKINWGLRFITVQVGPYGLRVVRFRSKKKLIKKAALI